MNEYFARSKDGTMAIFLADSDQMDRYLEIGWDIYEIENGEVELVATPEEGFLVKRPSFPKTETMKKEKE